MFEHVYVVPKFESIDFVLLFKFDHLLDKNQNNKTPLMMNIGTKLIGLSVCGGMTIKKMFFV